MIRGRGLVLLEVFQSLTFVRSEVPCAAPCPCQPSADTWALGVKGFIRPWTGIALRTKIRLGTYRGMYKV